jgi:hypothetical protein
MYNVNVAGKTVASANSYEAAVKAAKANVAPVVQSIAARAHAILNSNVYRSPRARARIAADLQRTAQKVADNGISLPRKAGNVSLNVGGVTLAIAKA